MERMTCGKLALGSFCARHVLPKISTARKKLFFKSGFTVSIFCNQNMEKTKKGMLGVQMKKRKKTKKRLLKQFVDYIKSDSYMFAPLITDSHSPSAFLLPKAKIISSSATGLGIKEPIIGKNKRFLKKIVDYLKSDSYMYVSMLDNQQISSPAKGPVRYAKRVTIEILRTITMDDNQPTVQSTNLVADDHIFEGNLPETSISGPENSAHREMVKNMVYYNCRSSSISGKGVLDSRLRKLLID